MEFFLGLWLQLVPIVAYFLHDLRGWPLRVLLFEFFSLDLAEVNVCRQGLLRLFWLGRLHFFQIWYVARLIESLWTWSRGCISIPWKWESFRRVPPVSFCFSLIYILSRELLWDLSRCYLAPNWWMCRGPSKSFLLLLLIQSRRLVLFPFQVDFLYKLSMLLLVSNHVFRGKLFILLKLSLANPLPYSTDLFHNIKGSNVWHFFLYSLSCLANKEHIRCQGLLWSFILITFLHKAENFVLIANFVFFRLGFVEAPFLLSELLPLVRDFLHNICDFHFWIFF